jgi:hypothetical protein
MATIGQILTAPETGWIRYDDMMIGGKRLLDSGCYDGTYHSIGSIGSSFRFKFTGTKIRIISFISSSNMSNNIGVYIDGVDSGTIDLATSSITKQCLVFEKTGLSSNEHSFMMVNKATAGSINIDAIDVETGAEVKPFIKSSIADMQIGDIIPCRYISATSGAAGTFSELGTCITTPIPFASSATPDGLFYWIMVGYDYKGRKKFIADRNIQHSISWDTLNSAGIATGSGVKVDLGLGSGYESIIRLPTGGISTTDKDNEWDKIIAESNLGGTITPGNDNIWHWNGILSWAPDNTTGYGSQYRAARGNASVSYREGGLPTTGISVATGFRPVLLVDSISIIKYLFQDGSDIKKYNGTTLETVGVDPVTEDMFKTYGMNDLNIPYSAISQMVSPVLLQYTNIDKSSLSMKLTAAPKDQLVIATGNIVIKNVQNIDSFTLTAAETGNGKVRIIASVDDGATWQAFNNGLWNNINPTAADVITSGMTIDGFNAVGANWNEYIVDKVRFGYALCIESATDSALVDKIANQVDLNAKWKKAIHGTDYDYEYNDNETLKITINTSGGYKVNY